MKICRLLWEPLGTTVRVGRGGFAEEGLLETGGE